MGSSNHATTSGDVEDQRQNPKWFVNHKHMLRPNHEDQLLKVIDRILKVPEFSRQPPGNFSPKEWHFGLHNRENLDSNGSEAIKLAIAAQYGLVGEKWVHFCDEIVDNPKYMLLCYGLQIGVTHWTDEQIKHVLTLDALFIATYIDTLAREDERVLWTPSNVPSFEEANRVLCTQYRTWMLLMIDDLYLVENQIPFDLIAKVAKYFIKRQISSDEWERAESNAELKEANNKSQHEILLKYQEKSLEIACRIMSSVFSAKRGTLWKINDGRSSPFAEEMHLLGAGFAFIYGSRGGDSRGGETSLPPPKVASCIHIPSATELEQSGIKIVGVNWPLRNMSYEKKRLYLPKLSMRSGTMSLLQNLARYEIICFDKSLVRIPLFHDYLHLMVDLIQAPEDWNLLMKCKVINDDGKIYGYESWSTLQGTTEIIFASQGHHEMLEKIKERCKPKRYKLWSEFNILFCSKPWLVLSTIAVVLVTVATLVQTYISVIGSNKMKPKFP